MPGKVEEMVVQYWLPIGLFLLFIEWVVLSPLKPVPEWNLVGMVMKLLYFSYGLGSYYFIRRLQSRALDFLWGLFTMGLLIVLMTEISPPFIDDIVIIGAVSSLGVMAITMGIYNAGNEWRAKNLDLRKRESQLESALRKTASLEEVNRLKSEFLSMTSHELRTPITPIMVQVQMLLQERIGKLNEKQAGSLRMIMRDTKRLDGLIADILDLSRLQQSAMRFDFEPNDINDVIRHAVKTMQYSARDKGIALTCKPHDIPRFVFDRDRITQVVTDLLSNAIKFTPAGGKISVIAAREHKAVVVRVRDTGIGILPEDKGKLFKPFSQIDSSHTRRYGGVGLGLSICKGIIEGHGGKIRAESGGPGKGSTFIFTIPFSNKAHKALSSSNAGGG